MPHRSTASTALLSIILALQSGAALAQPMPGTKPLEMQGDLASQMVAGVDKFLLREIDKSVERRARHCKRDTSSAAGYEKSIAPNREHLRRFIRAVDTL